MARCIGLKTNGEQCPFKARPHEEYCKHHIDQKSTPSMQKRGWQIKHWKFLVKISSVLISVIVTVASFSADVTQLLPKVGVEPAQTPVTPPSLMPDHAAAPITVQAITSTITSTAQPAADTFHSRICANDGSWPIQDEENFNDNKPGQVSPEAWEDYVEDAAQNITPTIEIISEDGAMEHVLALPSLRAETQKYVFRQNVTFSPPYAASVKLNYRTDNDHAGLVLGWREADRRERRNYLFIQANVYHNTIKISESAEGESYKPLFKEVENILLEEDYWLCAVVSELEQKQVEILWSTDSKNFQPITTYHYHGDLEGKVGLMASGYTLPNVYFDDFKIWAP